MTTGEVEGKFCLTQIDHYAQSDSLLLRNLNSNGKTETEKTLELVHLNSNVLVKWVSLQRCTGFAFLKFVYSALPSTDPMSCVSIFPKMSTVC